MSRCMARHFPGSTWRSGCSLLVFRLRRRPCSTRGRCYVLLANRRAWLPTLEQFHCRSSCDLCRWISWDLEWRPRNISIRTGLKIRGPDTTVRETWQNKNAAIKIIISDCIIPRRWPTFQLLFSISRSSRLEMKGKSLVRNENISRKFRSQPGI